MRRADVGAWREAQLGGRELLLLLRESRELPLLSGVRRARLERARDATHDELHLRGGRAHDARSSRVWGVFGARFGYGRGTVGALGESGRGFGRARVHLLLRASSPMLMPTIFRNVRGWGGLRTFSTCLSAASTWVLYTALSSAPLTAVELAAQHAPPASAQRKF